MNKFAIITVHKGNIDQLMKTFNSVYQQSHHPDLYLIIGKKINNLKELKKKSFIKIINNHPQDKSLWDAMNLGLKLTKDYFIMFLNSGDQLSNKKSIFIVKKKITNNTENCLVFKTNLIYKKTFFKIKKYNFFSKNYFPHPSFIRPKIKKKLFLFNNKVKIASDGLWIRKNVEEFGSKKYFISITNHYLGGISNNPNLISIGHQFKHSIRDGLLEFIKFIIKKVTL